MTETRELGKRISESVAAEEAKAEAETPEVTTGDGEPVAQAEEAKPTERKRDRKPKPTATPSEDQTKARFDAAYKEFHDALCAMFEAEELQPSQTPGVAGFVLPGYLEKKPHPDFARCTTCNGWGNVLTQSLKAGSEEQSCPDPRCKGRGYWQKAQAPAPAGPTLVPVPPAQPNGSGEWGEAPAWMGDPRLSNAPTP